MYACLRRRTVLSVAAAWALTAVPGAAWALTTVPGAAWALTAVPGAAWAPARGLLPSTCYCILTSSNALSTWLQAGSPTCHAIHSL